MRLTRRSELSRLVQKVKVVAMVTSIKEFTVHINIG